MRILSVHNRYKIRGGEDEVCEAEVALLRQMGHQVDLYQEDNQRVDAIGAANLALNTVWSQPSYRAVRRQLAQQPYDLVHVQNFFPLISPSVYYAADRIPVVQTLHNYRLICPNGLLFRSGKVCEECIGPPLPWPGVRYGCYRDNQLASATTAAMIGLHRILSTWRERVGLYIALTEFARQKFIAGGLPAAKIHVKPNFVFPDPGCGSGQGGYALFVGRLVPEKGIGILLQAWESLSMPLKLVGEGPLAEQVVAATQQQPQIEWLGRRPLAEVYGLMREAAVVIVPSQWYETFGRVVIEAFACGTPAIVTQLGALAELVDPGRTGYYCRPGDAADLAARVEWVFSHPEVLASMRRQARSEYERHYTAQRNYHRLMQIYDLALSTT